MRKLIIVCIILLIPFILMGQDHSQEYKVVCERIEGCPVINGTCPTCTLVEDKELTKEFDYDAWGKKLKESLRYQWDPNYYKNDSPKREPSGWGWDGPTWNGLPVLY